MHLRIDMNLARLESKIHVLRNACVKSLFVCCQWELISDSARNLIKFTPASAVGG